MYKNILNANFTQIKSLLSVINRQFSANKGKVNKKLKLSGVESVNESKLNSNIESHKSPPNLYLQIFSCLDKLKAFGENETQTKEKIQNLLKEKNIEINDEEIMQMISFNSSNENPNLKNKLSEEKITKILEYLEKIVEDEISEEEYAEDNDMNMRFIRPPHNVSELKAVFLDAEKIYEENKRFLFGNVEEVRKEMKEKFIKKIPGYLILRNLEYPQTDTEIMVMGVQRNSDTHSLFTADVLRTVNPDLVSVHLSPDLPLFIDGEGDYKKDWKALVNRRATYNFHINTLPQSPHEVLLNRKKIERVIDGTFALSDDIKISPKIIFSLQRSIPIRAQSNTYADSLLTPFMHSFSSRNSVDSFCPVAVCDYPRLKLYERIVDITSIDQLKEIFMRVIQEMNLQNYFYNYELDYKESIMMKLRMDYTAELLRQLSYSNKRIVLVINHLYVDCLIESWRNLKPSIQPIKEFYNDDNNKNEKEIALSDYIEKFVILDILQGSFINEHFIKYNTFPFAFRPYKSWAAGWRNIIMVWNHFYNHYSSFFGEIPFNNEHYNQLLKKYNVALKDEADMADNEKEMRNRVLDDIQNMNMIKK